MSWIAFIAILGHRYVCEASCEGNKCENYSLGSRATRSLILTTFCLSGGDSSLAVGREELPEIESSRKGAEPDRGLMIPSQDRTLGLQAL